MPLHHTLTQLRKERAEHEDEGFTLIELLVVVVIIGILVAIAIPLYLNYRTGAENKTAQADVRSAVSAVEACIADNANRVPTTPSSAEVASASGGTLYMVCTSTSPYGALSTSPTNANQTINVSDGVVVKYKPLSTTTYQLVSTYGTGHKVYTYTSSTGKTVAT